MPALENSRHELFAKLMADPVPERIWQRVRSSKSLKFMATIGSAWQLGKIKNPRYHGIR